MREFLYQLKWQILIIQRNNLITMIIGITAFYMLAIYFLKGLGNIEKIITLIILSDPAMIGFIFIGLTIILEKDQEVLAALFITPMNRHFYLMSRVLVLSLISLVCSLGMGFMAYGAAFNLIHFSIGAFSICVLCCFIGIYVVSFTQEILHFVLRSIPFLIVMSLPMLNYFQLTDLTLLKIFPMQGSIYLISNSAGSSPNASEIIYGYILIAFWVPVLYWFVYRTFRAKMVII